MRCCPVGCSCRIRRLLLCREIRTSSNECPGNDNKQSDGEVPVMLEFWKMQSTPSLLSLTCPLWSGVVAPYSVQSIGQIELNCVLMLNWIVWNRTCNLQMIVSLETIIWRLQVQSWLQASNNSGKLNTCTRLWLKESEQATPADSIKDVIRSSVKVLEFDKHLKKAGGHIGWNIVEMIIKMK